VCVCVCVCARMGVSVWSVAREHDHKWMHI